MAFSFRIGTNWCHDFPKLARESGFYFNMHRSRVRVDWNRISNIDIDRVIRDRDFYIVDENVNNVIDYCLESEYDVKILDSNFVKLFRLTQLAVEYLLYCKQYLDHSIGILKDELRSKIEENVKLKKEVTDSEEVIKRLKDKSKDRSRFVEAIIGDSNGEIFKCPHCPKTFLSAVFVTAHISRRHAYASELCKSSSPIHEHYRTETEKLHNEIKSLKERLNQTERVIRNESKGTPDTTKLDYERRVYNNELENSKNDTNKSEEFDRKGYQEEISNLKSMLFDEIRNLRQRDRTQCEHTSESNVQSLISQQEKEFQKLRNQLLEKLSPDLESMCKKLNAQEDYWKSKLEHLEQRHHNDLEKLTNELRLTQKAADVTKSEYESKVIDLERQSANQSNILLEQSKQLHSLSREINNSHNEGLKSPDTNLLKKLCEPAAPQQHNSRNYTESMQSEVQEKEQVDAVTEQIIIEDVDSVSSLDSTSKIIPLISKNKSMHKTIHTIKSQSRPTTLKVQENTKQRPIKQANNSNKILKDSKCIERNLQNYDSNDMSDTRDLNLEKQISSHATKHVRFPCSHVPNDRLSIKDSYINETRIDKSKNIYDNNVVQTFSTEIKSFKQPKTFEDDLTSETQSESVTLNTATESESESVSTIRKNHPVRENKTLSLHLLKSKKVMTKPDSIYKNLETDLKDIFNKKLRDLGIDPEWQGIPEVTFKQKMDILKHHQNLAAKKFPKYRQIQLKIIAEVLDKISRKDKKIQSEKSLKKSSLDKLVTNVKSKAMKAFSIQKPASPKDSKSVLKPSTGSVGGSVKKKVIFDLTNNKEGSLSDLVARKEELNESDWDPSSLSDEEEQVEKESFSNTGNIVLKTTQSDKIAEISRKLEAQLSMIRQKPVGSVETMFSSVYTQNKETWNVEKSQSTPDIGTLLESSLQTPAYSVKASNNSFPQPAPRSSKDKNFDAAHSISEGSDLDSDIDKILNLE